MLADWSRLHSKLGIPPEGTPSSYGNASVCAGTRGRTGQGSLGSPLDGLGAGSPLGEAHARKGEKGRYCVAGGPAWTRTRDLALIRRAL